MIKIVHLTSAHQRYDIRIFRKECLSLSNFGYDVSIVVADNLGDEKVEDIKIYDVGKIEGRFNRMLKTTRKVYNKALELNAEVYHLHDPELIPTGLKLKKAGKKVVFDAHEDLPKQILSKPYLNKISRLILSKAFAFYERRVCKDFDYIVTATSTVRDKFLKINSNCIDVNNYPIIGELEKNTSWINKENEVCYVGAIAKIRGIKELIRAMDLVNNGIKLNLLGKFNEREVEVEVKEHEGWSKVNELGYLERKGVAEIMGRSKAGIVTFLPYPNHKDSQPNKMFEYMSSGLPIITSNFPLWKEIVEGNKCGITVNPLKPEEISKAIMFIINNPIESEKMGENGKKAVLEKYNWDVEKEKLISVYKEII